MAYTDTDQIDQVMSGTEDDSGPAFINKKRKKVGAGTAGVPGPVQDTGDGPSVPFDPSKWKGTSGKSWEDWAANPVETSLAGAGADGTGNGSGQGPTTPKPKPPQPAYNVHPPMAPPTEGQENAAAAPGVQPSFSAPPQVPAENGAMPALAKQGSNNPLLRFFQKSLGFVKDSPKPGELYTAPVTDEEKSTHLRQLGSVMGKAMSGIGSTLAAGGGGMPQQHEAMQFIEEQPKLEAQKLSLQNEMQHRRVMEQQGEEKVDVSRRNSDTAAGRLDVSKSNAGTKSYQADVDGRTKGYVKQADGSARPMTSDDYANDPAAQADQNARLMTTQLKQAEMQHQAALTDLARDPNNPDRLLKARAIDAQLQMAQARIGQYMGMMQMRGAEMEYNYGVNPMTGQRLENDPNAPRTVAGPGGMPVPFKQQSLFGPTTSERNIGAQAKIVSDEIPSVIQEVQQNAALMGPILGRWNEFATGKVGAPNPQMAHLQTTLVMTASAVALAHARGRLPENLRQQFDNMIAAPQQDARNIVSVLQAIQPWVEAMGNMGDVDLTQGGQQPTQQAAPAPALGATPAPKPAPRKPPTPAHNAANSQKPRIKLE